jgi:hypothetical protein
MSKGKNHQFPTSSKTGESPDWMRVRPRDVQPLVLKGKSSSGVFDSRPPAASTKDTKSKLSVPPPPGNLVSLPGGRVSLNPEIALIGQELEAKIRAFSQAAVELGAARASALALAEGQLLDLAVAVATAILEREIERDPELYRSLVQTGLRALGATERAVLRVSKDSYAAILKVFGDEIVHIDGVEVRITLDLAIEGLGCIAESGDSRVDMSLIGRLRTVRRSLEEERRGTEAA